ncbi:MAG: InlB B-repeat-containing protein [Treponema sp.]|nr:InlB B-repeat-containing protein [Treponema sp.]
MKTLKSIFGRAYKVVTLFAVLFASALVYSCSSGLNGVSSSGKREDGPGGGGAAGGSSVAYISSVSLGDGERAIVPTGSFSLKGEEIYKYVLSARPAGGTQDLELGHWVRTEDDYAYDLMDNDLRDGTITLGTGAYIFTIQVYVLPDGITYESEDGEEAEAVDLNSQAILVLEKTTEPIAIVTGSNKIRFGTLNEASGNGKLSLKVRFPDEGVQSVTVRMDPQDEGNTYSVAETALDISDPSGGYRSVTFNNDPVNGWYVVKFMFTINNGAGDTTQVWSELVQIATGRQTQSEIVIDNLNAIYPIVYNFKGGRPVESALAESYSPYQGAIPMPQVKERNGATFDGWYSDPLYNNRVTELTSGSKGAKTFYAKWKYSVTSDALYACGAKVIVQQKDGSDTVTYAYFDEVNEDNVVLADDGKPFNIGGIKVYGSKPDGTYPDGTTDDITIQSGRISNIYARNTNGSVTVNGGTVFFIESSGAGGIVAVNGGTIAGDSNNHTAIYADGGNNTVNITGGTISGNVTGGITDATIKVSGTPVIGNKSDMGINLSIAKDRKIRTGNLDAAEEKAITLLAPSAENDTIVASFEGANAYAKFFAVLNANRTRSVKVADNGKDIVIEGGVSLPVNLLVKDGEDNTYNLGEGTITIPGTIFSVFVEGGYFTLTETVVADNVHFDMGIPVDERGKEQQFVYTADTSRYYRYIQYTSTEGKISGPAADDFLQSIEFHKIDNKPITIRIYLETVPITGNGYTLNRDVFYLDGSFYKKSEYFEKGKITWPQAYNKAKEQTFNALKGYLMTITSDAENKFVYDQIFGIDANPDKVGSWIGGTRLIPKNGYDASTWERESCGNKWVWAAGPEAGKTFYDSTIYQKDKNYRTPGMYSSWSNPTDCALNGITWYYDGSKPKANSQKDFEPNNGPAENYIAEKPDLSEKEVYTDYTGRYVWNDTAAGSGSQDRWQVHYYIVEFRPYENTATGERYVSQYKRWEAEQNYE